MGKGRPTFSMRLLAAAAPVAVAACTIQLVAPYNPDLAQRASSLQAEVAAWDLTMRKNAGTISADPRQADIQSTLNKWRGEQEAMLTLAISSDPGTIACNKAVDAILSAVESHIPASLGAAAPAPAGDDDATSTGCETVLVNEISAEIDRLDDPSHGDAGILKYCRWSWIADADFPGAAMSKPGATADHMAGTPQAREGVSQSCAAEFEVAQGLPKHSAEFGHGRAVSRLLRTLQAITYVESRKKAVASAKLGS